MTEDHDTLDQRLKDYGSRWRSNLTEAPALEELLVPPTRSIRSRLRNRTWIAAAVIVAVSVGATLWATHRLEDSERSPANPPEVRTRPVPWLPLDPTDPQFDARSSAQYSSLTAAGHLELTAVPGDQVGFTITLTSPTQVSLDPCPDYLISQRVAFDDVLEQPYALNCAAVPFKDADGKPFLPANHPLTFSMEVTAPEVDVPVLTWKLDVPNAPAPVRGALRVGQDGGDAPIGGGYCAALVFDGRRYELGDQQPVTGVGASLGKAHGLDCGADGDHEVQAYTANEQSAREALTVSYGDRVLTYAPEFSSSQLPVPYPDDLESASADVRGSDLALVRRFAQFAVRPSSYRDAVPFADHVEIGTGSTQRRLSRDSLSAASAWSLTLGEAAGIDGTVNALEVLRESLLKRLAPELPAHPDLKVSVGDHPRCAGPALPVPDRLVNLRHVAIEPVPDSIESCLDWFAIDLFVDPSGHVVTVRLELFEP